MSDPPGGPYRYLIALGGNVPHPRFGAPPAVLRAALQRLAGSPLTLQAASPVIATKPLGPSNRKFANAAAVVETTLSPPALLMLLQALEREFGRRRGGRRWSARRLDLDIVLWSGGRWRSPGLTIPHPAFRGRDFVLTPAAAIAPRWRDPVTGRTIAQLRARASCGAGRRGCSISLTRRHPLPRGGDVGP